MLYTEIKTIDGKDFTYNYSDTYMIRKIGTNEIYLDVYDPIKFKDVRKYEETDIELPKKDEEKEIEETK